MRPRHVATTLAAVTAALTTATALHRRIDRRLPAPATATTRRPETAPVPVRDGVVLPFVRRVVPAPVPERPASARRCGDGGGRTKAGAPCAARATTDGRCHHHRIAA